MVTISWYLCPNHRTGLKEKLTVNREFKLCVIQQTANGKRQAKKNFTVSGNKE
jgi:hypothetical protein